MLHTSGRESKELNKQWDWLQATIRVLCRNRLDVHAFFTLADANGDGRVERSEFVSLVHGLMCKGGIQTERKHAEVFWQLVSCYMDNTGAWGDDNHTLQRADVEHFLSIVDLKSA